jgi:hypothetical protein
MFKGVDHEKETVVAGAGGPGLDPGDPGKR